MKKVILAVGVCVSAVLASASITQYFSEYRTIVSVPAGTYATYTLVNSASSDGYYSLTVGVTQDDCASTNRFAAVEVRWTSPDGVAHDVELNGCGEYADKDLALSLKSGTSVTADTLSNENTTGNLKIHAGILGFWS
jgi:hypothetical protein